MNRIAFVALVFIGCTHVDAGHVGVEIAQCSGSDASGGVKPVPVGVGYHSTGPCTDIIEFPTFQQTAAFKDGENDKDTASGGGALSVNDSMGLPIKVDAVINFTIDGLKAPMIYQKFRRDLIEITNSYLRQVTYEATKDVFSAFTAQHLYSDKQEPARAAIQKLLAAKLVADGFIVTQFTINKTVVPQNVTQAIQAKVAMIEEAQRVEQELRKTEAESKKIIAAAEGAATARKMAADAEAYANQKLASSLSPVLVEYLRVQKWDGKMSMVSGSSGGTMVNLSTGTNK